MKNATRLDTYLHQTSLSCTAEKLVAAPQGCFTAQKILLLNAAVLPSWGEYSFYPIETSQAQKLVQAHGFISFIGHEAAAQLFSDSMGIDCPVNRAKAQLQTGQMALVLRLKNRLPEGRVINMQEMQSIGYRFGVLHCLLAEPDPAAIPL